MAAPMPSPDPDLEQPLDFYPDHDDDFDFAPIDCDDAGMEAIDEKSRVVKDKLDLDKFLSFEDHPNPEEMRRFVEQAKDLYRHQKRDRLQDRQLENQTNDAQASVNVTVSTVPRFLHPLPLTIKELSTLSVEDCAASIAILGLPPIDPGASVTEHRQVIMDFLSRERATRKRA